MTSDSVPQCALACGNGESGREAHDDILDFDMVLFPGDRGDSPMAKEWAG